jgi:hypothetical protein
MSNMNGEKLQNFLLKEGILIKVSLKEFNKLKLSNNIDNVIQDANELFDLGYGSKFISLCLSLKYRLYISPQFFHKKIIRQKNRTYFNDELFKKADISCKGRVFYNKFANSFYLTFKCAPLLEISRRQRFGVKHFFDSTFTKVFLLRDDRSPKKIISHQKDLFISLKPVPEKIMKYKKNSKKNYVSEKITIFFSASDFQLLRNDLIQDVDARKLYKTLEKSGFIILPKRITNMDRSKGDLHISRNNKNIVMKITKKKTLRAVPLSLDNPTFRLFCNGKDFGIWYNKMMAVRGDARRLETGQARLRQGFGGQGGKVEKIN